MSIDSSNISFIFQGPVINKTELQRSINSVKQFFPKSKIILSTWKGQNFDTLDVDHLLLNDDPGPGPYDSLNNKIRKNNINRQLISTLNGLKNVKTIYSIKIRTDLFFTSGNLLNLLMNIEKIKNDIFFKSKIIVLSDFSMNPQRKNTLYLNPSDWIYAGLTCDLLDLFTIPLSSKKELLWFKDYSFKKKGNYKNNNKNFDLAPRFSPEQYILVKYLNKKNLGNEIEDAFDEYHLSFFHNSFLYNNFLMYNYRSLGIQSLKYNLSIFLDLSKSYTEKEFIKKNSNYYFDKNRIFSNFINLIKKNCPKIIFQFLKKIYYFCKTYFENY